MDLTEDEIFERTISYFTYPIIDLGLRNRGEGQWILVSAVVGNKVF